MVEVCKIRGRKYVRLEEYKRLLKLVELSDKTIRELTLLLGRRSVSEN